jgi:hypothetical protein
MKPASTTDSYTGPIRRRPANPTPGPLEARALAPWTAPDPTPTPTSRPATVGDLLVSGVDLDGGSR